MFEKIMENEKVSSVVEAVKANPGKYLAIAGGVVAAVVIVVAAVRYAPHSVEELVSEGLPLE